MKSIYALKEKFSLSHDRILDNLPCVVFCSSKREIFKINYSSKSLKKWTGISLQRFYDDPETYKLLIHPEDRARVLSFFSENLSNGKDEITPICYRLTHKDGHSIWVEHHVSFPSDLERQGLCLSFLRDVTKMKEMELAFSRLEDQFKLFFEKGPLGIVFIDRNGTIVDCNNRFCELIGTDKKALIGLNSLSAGNPSLRDFAREVLRGKEIRYRGSYVTKLTHKKIYVSFSAFPIKNEEGHVIGAFAIVEDIKNTVELEKELSRQRDFNKATVETARIMVAEIDTRGKIVQANSIFSEFVNSSQKELVSRDIYDFVAEESISQIKATFLEAISKGKPLKTEALFENGQGEKRLLALTISPYFVYEQDEIHHLLIAKDITIQKKLEERLRHVQKMEAIGKLAGGVAHDFNNQLTAIMGYCQMILMGLEKGSELYEKLKIIEKAALKASETTNKLLAFSKKQALSPQKVSINQILKDACKFIGGFIGEDIDIEFRPCTEDCTVEIDQSRFLQVFLNLALNSRDAIYGSGKIVIEATLCKNGKEDGEAKKAKETVEITFQDNGCGMSQEVLNRAFEPFFTTKPLGKGTGLGLAMVYGTIKQSGGDITLESVEGKGTTVRIALPVYKGFEPKEEEQIPILNLEKGQKLAILVEDEPTVQTTVSEYLKVLGFDVKKFSNPTEVVEFLRRDDHDVPDLLLTDVIMPGMNGFELASHIKKQYRHIKIIFMSGYSGDVLSDLDGFSNKYHFLKKPFSVLDLSKILSSVFPDLVKSFS